jgi:hypothetical protein
MIKNWYKFNESNSDEYYNIIKDLLVDISDDFDVKIEEFTPPMPTFIIYIDVGFDTYDAVDEGHEIYSDLLNSINIFKDRINNEFFRIGKEISFSTHTTTQDHSFNIMDDEILTTIISIDLQIH